MFGLTYSLSVSPPHSNHPFHTCMLILANMNTQIEKKCLVSFLFLFFSEVTIKVYQTAEETVFSLVNLASFRVSMETLHHAGFTFTVPSIHIHWKSDSTFSSNKTLHRKKYKCDLFNGSNFPSSLSLAVNI